MGLQDLWIATLGDGLIRADHVTGIESHQTPALTGKPSRWLVDVTLAVPAGSGSGDGWEVSQLHRTLVQIDIRPDGAPEALARRLDELRRRDAAGVVRLVAGEEALRVEFSPLAGGSGGPARTGRANRAEEAEEALGPDE